MKYSNIKILFFFLIFQDSQNYDYLKFFISQPEFLFSKKKKKLYIFQNVYSSCCNQLA